MSQRRIYLDYNSTTPCDTRVVDQMLPYFYDKPGNAASRNHPFGWEAKDAVDRARMQIAELIGVEPSELIFTSGATESDNLALKGVFELYKRKGNHLITLKTEHSAVLDACKRIEKMGGEVTYLSVDKEGLIDLDELRAAIREDTVLVSVMWVNNETGVIQPMRDIGKLCSEKGVLFFSDATQAVGKIPVNPKQTGVHLMAFTAHKMYGPKGVGALFVNRKQPRVRLAPSIDGGGHEDGMRSGTLNVPGIVGFGAAAALAGKEMGKDAKWTATLRDYLEEQLTMQLEETYVNGSIVHRSPNVTNISFRFVDSEGLLATFNQEIAASTGSACSSASLEPSHVLKAMGLKRDALDGAVRFSVGRFTKKEDVAYAVEKIVKGVHRLRAESPIWEMFKEGIDVS